PTHPPQGRGRSGEPGPGFTLESMRALRPAIVIGLCGAAAVAISARSAPTAYDVREYGVAAGSHPHDVAPARDGGVWYTAQRAGELGWLDPKTGRTRLVSLGAGSAPHGVIAGPGRAAWVTGAGLN